MNLKRLLQFALQILVAGCAGQAPKTETATKPVGHDYTTLYKKIDSIVKAAPGRVGVALINLNTGDSFSYNGHERFPLFSTYKFPLALYILHQVEEGKLSLTQTVGIGKKEMAEYKSGKFIETHKADVSVSIDSMIYYAMCYSDNITTDNLFKLAGGAAPVNDFIHSKGVEEIAILNTVMEMNKGQLYRDNNCEPMAMAGLLRLFYENKVVNEQQRAYLLRYMEVAPSGAKRIKGLLPEGTVVAHKTGTGGANKDGVTAGVNDVGIVTLPNDERLALSVYVADIKGEIEAGETIIANIALAVYNDALAGKTN